MILQTENLTKEFGGLAAVSDVNYSVEKDSISGIIGPNGSGKTTLINLISGALTCSRGKILFCGQDITHVPAHERVRLGIGRIFQITNIFPKLTVYENVLVGLLREQQGAIGKFMFTPASKHTEIREGADRILQQTYLTEERNSLACNIPHGSLRRLEIAISISSNPQLLLLDEPMAGLTGEEMERMLNFIKYQLGGKHTVIIIEHRLDCIMRLAEKIAVMRQGKLIAHGTPLEIKESKEVREIYLGTYA